MDLLPKIIAVVGTTASGKSDLAVKIAREFNGEVISADSRQIYRGMDIGTNKEPGKMVKRKSPVKQTGFVFDSQISVSDVLSDYYEIEGVPHYLINVVNPDQLLTLAHIQALCFDVIEDILKRGKLPILAGGTGLYTSSITENWQVPAVQPDKNLRNELFKLSDIELIKYLDQVDKQATQVVDLKNRQRVIRAIEIAKQGKIVKSKRKLTRKYHTLYIAPRIDREKLYKRIGERFDRMVKNGLVDEVKAIGEKYGYDTVAMTGHGYKQIGDYLNGRCSLDEAIQESKKATRNYVKRQITWWKKTEHFASSVEGVHWVESAREASGLVWSFIKNEL